MNKAPDTFLSLGTASLSWLRSTGSWLGQWATRQSWGRIATISVCALIAQAVLTEHVLHWKDKHVDEHKVIHHRARAANTAPGAASDDSDRSDESADIHIDSNGVTVRHHRELPSAAKGQGNADPASPSTSPAATPPVGTGAGAAPIVQAPPRAAASSSSDDEDDTDEEVVNVHTQRTLGGWLADVLEGMVLLLITYLIGSKIVMRETAKSDARAAEAEASAAAAAALARTAEANAEREGLRFQLAQAELKTLQAQVEPHFLFNTLASVDYLIETDPARASAMQKNLIAYLRAALPQMRDHSSQLGRECALVQAYLEILKVRMEDRLKTVIDVPDGLRSAEFPPMLLQSLVENAIRHGLEPKAEGGEVRLTARIEDGSLVVQVIDTGMGLAAPAAGPAGDAKAADSGVGLRNVAERLALLYPGHASFALTANSPAGAIATVRLPYRVPSADTAGKAPPQAAT